MSSSKKTSGGAQAMDPSSPSLRNDGGTRTSISSVISNSSSRNKRAYSTPSALPIESPTAPSTKLNLSSSSNTNNNNNNTSHTMDPDEVYYYNTQSLGGDNSRVMSPDGYSSGAGWGNSSTNMSNRNHNANNLMMEPLGATPRGVSSSLTNLGDHRMGISSAKFSITLLKKRKWPLNGWHKRFFTMDHGILSYAKNKRMYERGKIKGSINIPEAAISVNLENTRIDIDAGEVIYHLRAPTRTCFYEFVDRLKYQRHMASMRTAPVNVVDALHSQSTEMLQNELHNLRTNIDSLGTMLQELKSSLPGSQGDIFSPKQMRDLNKTGEFDVVAGTSPEKSVAGDRGANSDLPPSSNAHSEANRTSSDSKVKKFMGIGRRRPSPNSKSKNAHPTDFDENRFPFQAQSFLVTAEEVKKNIESMMSLISLQRLNQPATFTGVGGGMGDIDSARGRNLESKLHHALKENAEMKQRLNAIAAAATVDSARSSGKHRATESVYSDVSTVTQWFDALDGHGSDAGDTTEDDNDSIIHSGDEDEEEMFSNYVDIEQTVVPKGAGIPRRKSSPKVVVHPGSTLSSEAPMAQRNNIQNISGEFLRPHQLISGDSGSDGYTDQESSVISADYTASEAVSAVNSLCDKSPPCRRSVLPALPANADVSLWSVMKNTIGKDLSRMSMPVSLNEPLNALQKLCEELEYSELLDKASALSSPYERMSYVAAFAVSGYASTYFRNGMKPFNPILGETYECVREEKGFRFVSEQISHHPPVSASHAESKNYILREHMMIKNKFWGKSMEIYPYGSVTLVLPKWNETYKWNKVTTTIHNIIAGKRYCDHYGEMIIENLTTGVKCKVVFKKSGFAIFGGSSAKNRNEINGLVTSAHGKPMTKLTGKWSEAIFMEDATDNAAVAKHRHCIWKIQQPPSHYEQYYGFTNFAMQLNEILPEDEKKLPHTDTRFRPDQRLVEEGDIKTAETEKLRVEQIQRDARGKREAAGVKYKPLYFQEVEQSGIKTTSGSDKASDWDKSDWVYKGNYWGDKRNGVASDSIDKLW
eukprot:Nk52_evm7s634 gene=Nk52_evmTU7s634